MQQVPILRTVPARPAARPDGRRSGAPGRGHHAGLPRRVLWAVMLPCLLGALGTGALPAPALAAPRAELWPRWEQHDEGNHLHIDHGAWDDFLFRNLRTKQPSGINRMDYAHVSRVDRLILDSYLKQQAALAISTYSRAEQKAYWINLYNALTVQVVLEHYPVRSIRDIGISPGLFSRGPWDAKLLKIEGQSVSLNDIEHRILRPIWRDPRVHYALNCASLGCPNLLPEAYTVFNMEPQLEQAARDYVNHPRGVRFEHGRLIVSSLYVWYEEDFGGSAEGVLAHLRRYARGPLAERLAAWRGGFSDTYDWALNAP